MYQAANEYVQKLMRVAEQVKNCNEQLEEVKGMISRSFAIPRVIARRRPRCLRGWALLTLIVSTLSCRFSTLPQGPYLARQAPQYTHFGYAFCPRRQCPTIVNVLQSSMSYNRQCPTILFRTNSCCESNESNVTLA